MSTARPSRSPTCRRSRRSLHESPADESAPHPRPRPRPHGWPRPDNRAIVHPAARHAVPNNLNVNMKAATAARPASLAMLAHRYALGRRSPTRSRPMPVCSCQWTDARPGAATNNEFVKNNTKVRRPRVPRDTGRRAGSTCPITQHSPTISNEIRACDVCTLHRPPHPRGALACESDAPPCGKVYDTPHTAACTSLVLVGAGSISQLVSVSVLAGSCLGRKPGGS